jgi:leader peptidase (prepilin peptidase)/N-methyltransferase
MMRIFATAFAALLGLAFGSFLNVCLSRWPEGESIVHPRSHCRACGRTLRWWENIPLLSWLALRGRCHGCGARISWRYPLVEAAISVLWAAAVWQKLSPSYSMQISSTDPLMAVAHAICGMIFYWIVVALAVLDMDHLWLPDWLTLPGVLLGFVLTNVEADLNEAKLHIGIGFFGTFAMTLVSILAAAGLILLIRWIYWLVRRQEGIGLGDAKLMAMLAAWLGLSGAMLSFFFGVVLGAIVAILLLIAQRLHAREPAWATTKLPLGAFLCLGGILSNLWGEKILSFYYRLIGL